MRHNRKNHPEWLSSIPLHQLQRKLVSSNFALDITQSHAPPSVMTKTRPGAGSDVL